MKDFITSNTQNIFRAQWKTIVLVALLLSFLLILINVFATLVYGINQFSDNLKSKLGIYLYVKEDPTQVDEIYNKVKQLSQSIKQAGMHIKYYSKADALERLQNKIPDVIKNFQKYGINNPLPPTLYITFQKENDLETLQILLS